MTHTVCVTGSKRNFRHAHALPAHLRSYLLRERWSTFFDFTDKNACGKEQMERYFGTFSKIHNIYQNK